MFYEKHIKNNPILYRNDMYNLFLCSENQRKNTKEIYILHRSNNGKLGYLFFKEIVPEKMRQWYKGLGREYSGTLNNLEYLNSEFIKGAYKLYSTPLPNTVMDSNVFDERLTISYVDDNGNITKKVKDSKNLMAEDYQNLDVWRPTTTYLNQNIERNTIPVWQKYLHNRNIVKDSDGFRYSSECRLSGYEKYMDMVKQAQKNKRY
jgi:hypothetical protein